MAIRNIVTKGNEILSKKCKPVKEITPHIKDVMKDMVDTMNEADGVGLAAPQIGIMKRFFVAMPYVDKEEDDERRDEVFFMINPEILSQEGSQVSNEGCLSVPGYIGVVERPQKVRMKALDLDGNENEYEFEGFAATVVCHEYDHLEGRLYTDLATELMTNEEYAERLEKEEESSQEQ